MVELADWRLVGEERVAAGSRRTIASANDNENKGNGYDKDSGDGGGNDGDDDNDSGSGDGDSGGGSGSGGNDDDDDDYTTVIETVHGLHGVGLLLRRSYVSCVCLCASAVGGLTLYPR